MFLPPDERRIYRDWEPPKPEPDRGKRQGNAAIVLILLVSALALFAPIAGGTIPGMFVTLFQFWGDAG
ncbi:hypothetical protein [Methylobacterium sp. CM6257]